MSIHVYNKIEVYGDDDDLKSFINELGIKNKNNYGDKKFRCNLRAQFEKLSKVSNPDQDIKDITTWYKEKPKNDLIEFDFDLKEIKSDHIVFFHTSPYHPPYEILYMFIKNYKKLRILNDSCMSICDYPYNWTYFLEGENGQYTREEIRDYDSISWTEDLDFDFEYKFDGLNASFTLTSANIFDKVKGQHNKYTLCLEKEYEVIPWFSDFSIMIELFTDCITGNIRICKGKIFNNMEVTEAEAKNMLEFIYNDESFSREVFWWR